jgi:hypothetical protein
LALALEHDALEAVVDGLAVELVRAGGLLNGLHALDPEDGVDAVLAILKKFGKFFLQFSAKKFADIP